ncbi:MAG: 16S rRNA (adenine(1518)-N(6)/adenine(1519)-N(6))-dimethyltransferase RsmA [Cyclobacteriaceae bacterium]
MTVVRPKKHLGQHFLKDKNIARKIVQGLSRHGSYRQVLEIGPGTGVLTQFLLQEEDFVTSVIELDTESVAYLQEHYPELRPRIYSRDFLKTDLMELMKEPFAVIGNFPYNISSQIFFRILDIRNEVPEIVCMLQKEVADRLKSPPGSKEYGILSVLLQAYYDIDYLFTVEPGVFNPPPKVRSGVIRLRRNAVTQLECDEQLFRRVVKQSFQTRRKTLRNALKPLNLPETIRQLSVLDKRAEQLSVGDFTELTKKIEEAWQ